MKKLFPLFLGAAFLIHACQETSTTSIAKEDKISVPEVYLQNGKKVASATFLALSTTLKSALEEHGVTGAVEYCQTRALPIVDSMSTVHGVQIRRTSLKVRNPEDTPTEREREVLLQFQKTFDNGTPLTPVTEYLEGTEVAFYAPIMTNDLCLQCHGIPGETLTSENLTHIRQLYPEDEAIGYNSGELRGMWSITFPAEQ